MNRQLQRFNSLSRTSKSIFTVVLIGMILIGLYAFFTSDLGRTITLVCCGGIALLVIVGLISEGGMGR